MNNIEENPSFQQAEQRLKSLIEQLEERLRKTDIAAAEAKEIRKELEKLKEQE